jgi:hypothetical protein
MPPKKEEAPKGLTLFEQLMLFLFILFFLLLLWYRINAFFVYYHGSDAGSIGAALAEYSRRVLLPIYYVIATIASALALWGIVVEASKLSKINHEEHEVYGMKSRVEEEAAPVMKNERWERVITHINSANASDWRLAIIEADVMLDELLKTIGAHGDSLGERLKSIDNSEMTTLDNAWEAHRVRNQVAHQGADYPLSEREAKRAISLYESVFREFKII